MLIVIVRRYRVVLSAAAVKDRRHLKARETGLSHRPVIQRFSGKPAVVVRAGVGRSGPDTAALHRYIEQLYRRILIIRVTRAVVIRYIALNGLSELVQVVIILVKILDHDLEDTAVRVYSQSGARDILSRPLRLPAGIQARSEQDAHPGHYDTAVSHIGYISPSRREPRNTLKNVQKKILSETGRSFNRKSEPGVKCPHHLVGRVAVVPCPLFIHRHDPGAACGVESTCFERQKLKEEHHVQVYRRLLDPPQK